MLTLSLAYLLAQIPASNVYVNLAKLITIALVFLPWVLFAQWTDKDAVAVNTYRIAWNLTVVCVGAVALALLFLIPIFWIGLGAFVFLNLGVGIAYVVHRNGLVIEESKVGTPAHISRLMKEGFGGKKEKLIEVNDRVRLSAHDRRAVPIPEDQIAREQYRITQDVLFDALWRRAGLIEILPAGQASRIRLDVDGIVSERDIPRGEGEYVEAFLKGIAGLNVEERRKPQRGKMQAAIGDHKYEVQVRTDGSTAGEKMSLRILGNERGFKVPDLGLNDKQMSALQDLMYGEKGVIVLSAPPAGGLSTTVYSVARSQDAFLKNIQTLEYEREMDIENITQHVFDPNEEGGFAGALQKIVRSDPDVMVIPQLRDRPAAGIISQAAARKQIMIVGLQAADMLDALVKWIGMVADPALVAKTLAGVTHQRLVRKLCPSCRAPYKPDPATMQKLNLPPDGVLYRPPEPQFDKHGKPIICQACQGSGYVGRTAVFTILTIDDEVRQVIRAGAAPAELRAVVARKGALSIQTAALKKVLDGTTSIEELVRATRPAKAGAAAATVAPASPKPVATAPRPTAAAATRPRAASGDAPAQPAG